MNNEELAHFNTIEEARSAGYRICQRCAPIGKYYRAEYFKIKQYAIRNGLIFYMQDGILIIETPYSKWKIITNGTSKHLFLYHRNTYERKKDKSLVKGYHSQAVRSNTIMGYFEYIVEHDHFRLNNEIVLYEKKVKTAPRKGTKRYRKEQNKRKRQKHYRDVKKVINLIEEMSKDNE